MKHRSRKPIRRWLTVIAITAAALTTTVAQAQGKAPIKFDTSLDFTAVYTFVSVNYSQGQQDYIKLLNMEGGIDGHPVKLIINNTQNQPQKGIAFFQQGVAQGAVLFDFLSTPVSTAMLPRVLKNHVNMITYLHGQAAASDGKVFPYVFIASATYWSQAAVLLQYMDKHEGGLKGKKIAFVYIDSPFGREPIQLIKAVAKQKGFTLGTFAYPSPGTQQTATWTRVRNFHPNFVMIWGAGPGQDVSIRQAVSNGISPKQIYSVVWLAESDMKALPPNVADGVHRFTAVLSGTGTPILQKIVKKVVDTGHGSGKRDIVGETYYNIGVATMALATHAAKLAIDKYGWPLTGETLAKGFDMVKDFGAGGLTPPVTITAADHQGGGWGRVSQWNGKKWVPVSDWTHAYQNTVWKLIKADAAKFQKTESE